MSFMRFTCAALLGTLLVAPVFSQEEGRLSGPAVDQPCMECGVIYEIKAITTERAVAKTLEERAPPAGPFINIPLTRKAEPEIGVIGSKQRREQLTETEYEVVVRYDDGRFTLIKVRDVSNLRVGDRVHVHQNRIEPIDKP